LSVGPTASYLMEMAIQYGSFLAVCIGCWKYKDEIHMITCRKRYTYHRNEVASIGSDFFLEIPIIRLELEEQNPMIKFMKRESCLRA